MMCACPCGRVIIIIKKRRRKSHTCNPLTRQNAGWPLECSAGEGYNNHSLFNEREIILSSPVGAPLLLPVEVVEPFGAALLLWPRPHLLCHCCPRQPLGDALTWSQRNWKGSCYPWWLYQPPGQTWSWRNRKWFFLKPSQPWWLYQGKLHHREIKKDYSPVNHDGYIRADLVTDR